MEGDGLDMVDMAQLAGMLACRGLPCATSPSMTHDSKTHQAEVAMNYPLVMTNIAVENVH